MDKNIIDIIINSEAFDDTYKIKHLLKNNQKICIVGAGEGLVALERTIINPYNLEIEYFIDAKFSNINEKNKCTLEEFFELELEDNFIFILTFGNGKIRDKYEKELKSNGFVHLVWAPDIYEYSLHHFDKDIINGGVDYFIDKKDRIFEAYNLLEDKKSKDLFYTILTRYITMVPNTVDSCSFSEQYLLVDFIPFDDCVNYISCGAYTGDSVEKVLPWMPNIKNIFAFEPDPINFYELKNTCVKIRNETDLNLVCLQMGLHAKSGFLNFSNEKGLSSSIDENGSSSIYVSTVDDIFNLNGKTFLTMDIEGAEIDALKGAKNFIVHNKPYMAISVYHYPHHLWDILLYLHSINPNYKFKLRNYSGFTYESVLYASY